MLPGANKIDENHVGIRSSSSIAGLGIAIFASECLFTFKTIIMIRMCVTRAMVMAAMLSGYVATASAQTIPSFTWGSTGFLSMCQNAAAMDIKPLLHVDDVDASQSETWTELTAPVHGSLIFVSATAPSGGTGIVPGGTISYTPLAGYSGPDMFSVLVSDGADGTDTLTVSVLVNALPLVNGGANIAICSGDSAELAATGGYTYSWAPTTGLSCTTCADPVASPTVTTTYTVTGTGLQTTAGIVYNEHFVNGVSPTTQCNSWEAFTASLLGTYVYTGFTMRGSNNPIGISCTDPVVATAVANALRTKISYSGSSDGQNWYVGNSCMSGGGYCGTTAMELANQGTCSCAPGYSIRPQINNDNWGGIDGPTCNAPSQTIEIIFYTSNGLTSGGCSNSATITVSVNPLPAAITGVSQVCTGRSVSLSDTGGGTWATGNSATATVDASTGIVAGVAAGSTQISYFSPEGCYVTTDITVLPLPARYTASGGGGYCKGDSGVNVFLSMSDTGVSYQLYDGSALVGSPIAGNDSAIDFGRQTSGIYSVFATNDTNGCTSETSTTVTVIEYALPNVYNVTGGGHYCTIDTGVHISLSGSDAGVDYGLYKGGSLHGMPFSGTGVPIDFGLDTLAGIYKVIATDMMTGCKDTMSDSAIVTRDPLLIPAVSIYHALYDTVCQGATEKFTALTTNGGPAPFYQWSVNGVNAGTNSPLYSYLPSDGDVVVLAMTSNEHCMATIHTALTEVTMVVDTIYIPVVNIAARPGFIIPKDRADTFRAVVKHAGPAPTYQWYKNKFAVSGATNSTYVCLPNTLSNSDSISCIVTGSGKCGLSSFNGAIIQVITTGINEYAETSSLKVVPNPNNGQFSVKGRLAEGNYNAAQIEIANMLGQIVYSSKVAAANGVIDTDVKLQNTLPGGMYLLSIRTAVESHVFHIVIEQ